MKKTISVLLSLILLICLTGCTLIKPEDKVNEFLSAIKTQDKNILMGYADNKYINMLVNNSEDEKTSNEIYSNLFKNLNYKIISSSVDEKSEDAIVKVEISNTSFKNVFKNYEKKSYDYVLNNLYSKTKTKKSNLNKKFMKIFSDEIIKASKSKKKVTKTINIKLTKNENYGYDLKPDKNLINALTGGLISSKK